jgi:glycine cleavage system H protein
MTTTPSPDLLFTPEHEWLRVDGDLATVGITAFAAEALGDIVFVALPAVGDRVTAGAPCGELESTKSVSDLYAPATGVVVEVNAAAVEEPETVGADPFGKGWLFVLRIEALGVVLDADGYAALTRGE